MKHTAPAWNERKMFFQSLEQLQSSQDLKQTLQKYKHEMVRSPEELQQHNN
jgi:hypothetical protein